MMRQALFEIVPSPERVRLEPEFKFWRDLPKWHRKFGCPDCRKTLGSKGAVLRHLKDYHPRWEAFCAGIDAMRHPPPLSPEERRAKLVAASKATWARPEVRAKRVAASKATWARPEVRAKLVAASKATWARPEVRAKLVAAMNRPEVRAKLVAAAIKSRFWEFRHKTERLLCPDCSSHAHLDAADELVRCDDRVCGWVGVA